MLMGDRAGVLPGMDGMIDNLIHARTVPDLREDKRAGSAHFPGIALHNAEVRPDGRSQVGLIDDQQVGLRNAGAAFAGNLIASGDVNNINGVIGQFAAEMGGEVVASGFQQQELRVKFLLQFFQSQQVGGNIFANRGMGATAGFNRADAFGLQSLVADQEFAVFLGENVVGNSRDVILRAQTPAESQQQCRFAAAHGSTDANGEGALVEVARHGLLAFVKMAGVIQVLVAVLVAVSMRAHKFNSEKAGNKADPAFPAKFPAEARFGLLPRHSASRIAPEFLRQLG